MSIGLEITYLYHDIDIVEVRISVANAQFCGSADVYVGRGELLEVVQTLKGFPKHTSDTREIVFGAFGPTKAGGAVRCEFYCKDLAGHTALRAVVEEDYRQGEFAQGATVLVDFEPAALDAFLTQLELVENQHDSAALYVDAS